MCYKIKIKRSFSISITFFLYLFLSYTGVSANPNDVSVEGDMTRFVTGNAYPTEIQFAGYNAQSNTVFVSIGLEGGDTTSDLYNYEINIFDDFGGKWASFSDTNINEANPDDHNILEIYNKGVTGSSDLPISHRIVVTVTNFTNN